MTTYRFSGIKAKATRKGECPVCGNVVTRSRTFEKTVNPFNCNTDGTPKSRSEVRADVQAEAAAWAPAAELFVHDACRGGAA